MAQQSATSAPTTTTPGCQLDFFKMQRPQSKYEQYGPGLQDNLRTIHRSGNGIIHDYQIEAVFHTRAMIEGGPDNEVPVLIVAPTGSGKSGMIALLPYVLQSRRVLVLTPSKEITDQLAVAFGINRNKPSFLEIAMGVEFPLPSREKERFRDACEPVHVISHSNQIINERLGNLVIVNAQKFGGRSGATLSVLYGRQEVVENVKEFFAHFDTLLVDEAHHYPATTWKTIVDTFTGQGDGGTKKVVFLTATPTRMENGVQVPILPSQRVAFHVSRKSLEGKTIRPSKFIEQEGYKDVADFKILATHMTQILRENGNNEERFRHQALIYVRTKFEADKLAEKLNFATNEPNFAIPIYNRPSKDKDVENFNNGDYQVAIVCGCLREGYDNSNVSLCVILKNMQSRPAFSQFVGRCLRMKRFGGGAEKDKTVAVILSYSAFKQQILWGEWEEVAEADPFDDEFEEDE